MRFSSFSKWNRNFGCEGFCFTFTTFNENHFIWRESFYEPDSFYDSTFWRRDYGESLFNLLYRFLSLEWIGNFDFDNDSLRTLFYR